MVSHSELRKLFPSADAVCFDVDSTVMREEGTDELAKMCGIEDAVSEIPEAVRHVNLKDIGTGWPDSWPWVGQCLSKVRAHGALTPNPALQGAGAETYSRAPRKPDSPHKVRGVPVPGVFQHQCWGAHPPESF
uniref:Uncharacterized protein n=1 Tax=Pan troglodytes TaxID=9598 RepID=A0A2I3RRH3_PANTR